MTKRRRAWLAVALCGITPAGIACRTWGGEAIYESPWNADEGARIAFGVGLPGGGWTPHADDGVQVAWTHDTLASMIQVRAQCHEHGDSSLEMFTEHIAADFSEWERLPLRPGTEAVPIELRIVERDALRTRVEARLDGAPIRMDIIVVKKNGCLFDLMYIAAPASFAAGLADFERVVAGFEFPVLTS